MPSLTERQHARRVVQFGSQHEHLLIRRGVHNTCMRLASRKVLIRVWRDASLAARPGSAASNGHASEWDIARAFIDVWSALVGKCT